MELYHPTKWATNFVTVPWRNFIALLFVFYFKPDTHDEVENTGLFQVS